MSVRAKLRRKRNVHVGHMVGGISVNCYVINNVRHRKLQEFSDWWVD